MQRRVAPIPTQTAPNGIIRRHVLGLCTFLTAFSLAGAYPETSSSQEIPEDQLVTISPEITQALPNGKQFVVRAPQASEERRDLPVSRVKDPAASMVNRLYIAGRAVGLNGVLYDNRDARHSNLSPATFPQLRYVAYSPELSQYSRGLAGPFLFDQPVIGNASVAVTRGLFRRSMPRLAMTDNQSVALAQSAYANNQIYVYPEHQDHDPKDGDLFHANLPYFVVSQGSSHSDRPFMRALALTYGAYSPETFDMLRENGLLASTTQMILRRTLNQVKNDNDYLKPQAHPSAFRKGMLRPAAMVSLASSIPADAVPPRVNLRVIEDLEGRPGADFLVRNLSQTIFTSPGAIARAWRSFAPQQRMVLSAADTVDPNGRDLSFHWRVMRGNPDKISILPSGPGNSSAEIVVDWHEPEDLIGPSDIPTRRIEIAAFAHNGEYYSAPAFISIAVPVHQNREYAGSGAEANLWKINYDAADQYVDPLLWPVAPWFDRISYGSDGEIDAMTRTHLDRNDEYALIPDYPGTWLVRRAGIETDDPVRITHRAGGPPQKVLEIEEIKAE